MKQLFITVVLFVLAGCASKSTSSEFRKADQTQTMVLQCASGLAKCYSTANEICGSRGFDELDRPQVRNLTAAGRLEDQGDGRHVYREDLRIEADQQTLAFRCK